jgi:hypothetical protein
MDEITKEIASLIQSQIETETAKIQISGLSADQAEEVLKFARSFSRKSPFFPYPLKNR